MRIALLATSLLGTFAAPSPLAFSVPAVALRLSSARGGGRQMSSSRSVLGARPVKHDGLNVALSRESDAPCEHIFYSHDGGQDDFFALALLCEVRHVKLRLG